MRNLILFHLDLFLFISRKLNVVDTEAEVNTLTLLEQVSHSTHTHTHTHTHTGMCYGYGLSHYAVLPFTAPELCTNTDMFFSAHTNRLESQRIVRSNFLNLTESLLC